MMDKTWVSCNRATEKFEQGARNFVKMAEENVSCPEKMLCPCNECRNIIHQRGDVVYEHLVRLGMDPAYVKWVNHGEERTSNEDVEALRAAYMKITCIKQPGEKGKQVNKRNDKLKKLITKQLEEPDAPLYPGCPNFTKSSFLAAMNKVKVENDMENKGFGDLIELCYETFPKGVSCTSASTKKCNLLDLFGSGVVVAEGRWCTSDPEDFVHQTQIGPNAMKVQIDTPIKPETKLWRPSFKMNSVAEAVGSFVAWPSDKVVITE